MIGKLTKAAGLTLLCLVALAIKGPTKAAAAEHYEGTACFKNTGYVNTAVMVAIQDENGNFVRWSNDFTFNVKSYNPFPAYPVLDGSGNPHDRGIGQDADNNPFYNDGLRWEGNSRAAPYGAVNNKDFHVRRDFSSSSICTATGGAFGIVNAPAQVFGDRTTDGHPYLACQYGNYGQTFRHGLGFKFQALTNYDTGGHVGHWEVGYIEKSPASRSDDINNLSTNAIFIWRYDKPTQGSGRLVIDSWFCDDIRGWAYSWFLASKNPKQYVDVHIYVDGGPAGTANPSPYGGWPLTANESSPDLTQATTGLGMFWIDGNYRFHVNPKVARLAGLDLSVPHVLNFYTPNVPVGASGPNMGATLVDWRTMDPSHCPNPYTNNFDITPSGATNLRPDTENPTSVEFSGSATSTHIAKGIDFTCVYTKEINGVSSSIGSDSPNDVTVNTTNGSLCGKTISITGLRAGDKVCQVVTVKPGSGVADTDGNRDTDRDGGAKSSTKICDTVVNKPYLSVYGSDVYTGGGYTSPCSRTSDIKTFTKADSAGSGVQFAAYVVGAIEVNGTESKGFNTARLRGSAPSAPNGLTFANTDGINSLNGSFGQARCQYDYYKHRDDAQPAIAWGGVFGNKKYKATGPLVLADVVDVSIADSTKTALYVDGDVTIKHNIVYASADSGWGSPSEVSSFYLIVHGNIYIDPGVTRLDGVYIAEPKDPAQPSGVVLTCANTAIAIPPNPTNRRFALANMYSSCDNKLTINGSLQAQHVYFDRSASKSLRDAGANESGARTSEAAEVINYSPDLFLTSPQIAREEDSGGSSIQSIQVLPPLL